MRKDDYSGYKRIKTISTIVSLVAIALAIVLVIVLFKMVQNKPGKDHEVEASASAPDHSITETASEINLIIIDEKEAQGIPDDVVYSDEGRAYSKTYDYTDTPALNRLGSIVLKEGFEIEDPDTEFLDKKGNIQTGRELYTLNAYKEDENGSMLLNFYMVPEEDARSSFDEIKEKDGIWCSDVEDYGGGWYVCRTYDPQTGVMMDASGDYPLDWETMGLFD